MSFGDVVFHPHFAQFVFEGVAGLLVEFEFAEAVNGLKSLSVEVSIGFLELLLFLFGGVDEVLRAFGFLL